MEPIIYREGSFPIELTRRNEYIAFRVGWNEGIQKFNVFEQCKFGWQTNNTTSGAYTTFADAYAAVQAKARDLAEFRDDIALLAREDNAKRLLGSWGISLAQIDELNALLFREPTQEEAPTSHTISTVGNLRRALEHIPDGALLNIGTNDLGFEVSTVEYDGINVSLESKQLEEDLFERSRNVHAPDEIVVRLAHYAGELAAVGQIRVPNWDDLCAAIQSSINDYYDRPGYPPPSAIEQVAEQVFKKRFPAGEKGIQPNHLALPDGTTVQVSFSEGHVNANGQDERTWQSLDVQRHYPDGKTDPLCCVDFESELGLRTIIYNKNGDEDPVFCYRHDLPAAKSTPLDSIIKSAENRKETPSTQRSYPRKEHEL